MKKVLSVILVFSMVLSCAGFCFAAEDHNVMLASEKPTIKYVHLGDSFSNGFGLVAFDEYNDGIGADVNLPIASPAYVRDYLAALYPDAEIDFHNLASAGFRTEEVACLLDVDNKYPHQRDDESVLLDNYWGCTIEELKINEFGVNYVSRVRDADVITMEFGNNNIEIYLSNVVWKGSDDLQVLLKSKGIDKQWNRIRADLLDKIKQYTGVDLEAEEYKSIEATVDGLIYALWDFMDSFDLLCKEIYELNPDVQLYVVGIPTTMPELRVDLGRGSVPLGILCNAVHAFMNIYMRQFAEYSRQYAYIDTQYVNVDLICTQVKNPVSEWDEEILAAVGNMLANYKIPDPATPEMLERIAASFKRNPALIILSDGSYTDDGLYIYALPEEVALIQSYLSGSKTDFSKEEQEIIDNVIYSEVVFGGFCHGVHPSKSGHKQMGQAMIAGIKKHQANEAIKPVMKELPKLVTAGLTLAIPKITLDLKALEFKLHRPALSYPFLPLPKLLPLPRF